MIKSVVGNMLLPWLGANFSLGGMLLVIRHPCSTAVSLKMHGTGAARSISKQHMGYVREHLPHLVDYVQRLKTPEELLTVRWCVEQHAPLRHAEGSWIQVLYEKLILDGYEELERIHAALNLPIADDAERLLRTNSLRVGAWSVDHSRASAEEWLSGWKRRLSDEQAKRVLSVVEAFGITGYTSDIAPVSGRVQLAG
ncbi:MAG: hypothetical protein ACYTF6_00630 [Planctomycetota bacterium]